MSARLAILALFLSLLPVAATTSAPERLADLDDAYVEVDRASGRWTVGNDGLRMTVEVDSRGALFLDGLRLADGTLVTQSRDPDGLVSLGGVTTGLGARGSALFVESVGPVVQSNQLEMQVRLRQSEGPLRVVRHYAVYPHVPIVEVWTSFESDAPEPAAVMNLNAFDLALPVGEVHWVNGLEGSPAEGGPFDLRSRLLTDGESVNLGGPIVSSASHVPYFTVEQSDVTFVAGLAWSGGWSAVIERNGAQIRATMGLPDMSAWVTSATPVNGPHALIGAAHTAPGADTAALAAALRAGRGGRAYPSLSAFNTWFVYGARIDQNLIRHSMFYAERADIELYQVDAGWYPQSNPESIFDFTNGLGSWKVDQTRFPDGLGSLGDYSRVHGMKFGVWVEPERVALSTVNQPGLAQERFLATTDGAYHPGVANQDAKDGQICLGDAAAREWLWEKLVHFIDDVRPDYLKWDYNRFMICNRPGHGHPTDGGNFAHVQGLYDLFARLHAQYPRLIIENCSGGGRRLDFAMARLTDTGWMDDQTSPSRRVRNNLEGLSRVFPAPYLFSYILPDRAEPLDADADLPLIGRSRLPGTVGLSVDFDTLAEDDFRSINRDIKLAATLRPLQADAVTLTLSPQAAEVPDWDIVEQVSSSSGRGVLFAFETRPAGPTRVRLQRLSRGAVYELRSVDRGLIGRFSGASLADDGLLLEPADEGDSAAQVITFDLVSAVFARR